MEGEPFGVSCCAFPGFPFRSEDLAEEQCVKKVCACVCVCVLVDGICRIRACTFAPNSVSQSGLLVAVLQVMLSPVAVVVVILGAVINLGCLMRM